MRVYALPFHVPGDVYETPDKPQPSDYRELSTMGKTHKTVESQYVNQAMVTANEARAEYIIN